MSGPSDNSNSNPSGQGERPSQPGNKPPAGPGGTTAPQPPTSGLHDSQHAPQMVQLSPDDLRRIVAEAKGQGRAPELRLNPPAEFSGDLTKARDFLSACKSYLALNSHIYTTDAHKILFVLSYMRSGQAAEWAEYWREKILQSDDRPVFTIFADEFEKAFISSDVTEDARVKLLSLRQNGTADEYNAQFKMLASRAKINEYSGLEQLYQRGLSHKLLERIYTMNTLPETMEQWYQAASRLDNQDRRFRMIVAGLRDPWLKQSAQRYKAPERHPDDMDVDRITTSQRERYRREGRCFECGSKGHRIYECPRRQRRNPKSGRFERRNVRASYPDDRESETEEQTKKNPDKRPSGGDNKSQIKALLTGMGYDERDKFFDELEKEGF